MNSQEDFCIRDFYFSMRGYLCDLEQHVEGTREALVELDGDIGLMKLLLDALSVRVKDLDQPYKKMKTSERLIPPLPGNKGYEEDAEFMANLHAVWGWSRPFWQECNGLFYCQIYNPNIKRYQDIPLGFDKSLVIERIQMLEQNE